MKPPAPKKARRRTPSNALTYTRRMADEHDALFEFLLAEPNECAPYWRCVTAAMVNRHTCHTKRQRLEYTRKIFHLIARLQYENKLVRAQKPRNVLFIPEPCLT